MKALALHRGGNITTYADGNHATASARGRATLPPTDTGGDDLACGRKAPHAVLATTSDQTDCPAFEERTASPVPTAATGDGAASFTAGTNAAYFARLAAKTFSADVHLRATAGSAKSKTSTIATPRA